MTEPSKGLFYLPIIYLWTGVKGYMLTALAPPVHLSGDRLGWTLLVCMVSDLRRGHLEVRWRFPSGGYMSESPFSVVVNSRPKGHSPVAMITVATNDWPAYRCSVNHKRRPKVTKGRLISSSVSGDEEKTCYEDEERGYDVWTNTVIVLTMRLLLLKILVFNTLLSIYAFIK